MTLVKQLFEDRRRSSNLSPLAVIDIGSNSVRLVVYEGASRAPVVMFNEKVLCGLGRNVATTGRLGDEAVQRAIRALARFRALADVLKVKSLQVFATAAAREAENGAAFIDEGESVCGAPIRVLTGEEEARLAAQGIVMGISNPDGIVGDLGGGSLELIDLRDNDFRRATTLPLGGLRLIDATGNKIDKAMSLIDEQLDRVDWLPEGRDRTFYAVGGTWRAIAAMHMAQIDYPLHVMHGYVVPTQELIDYAGMIRKAKKLTSLRGISEVAKARREVLPMGAAVLERLLVRLAPQKVQISVFGVREGYIYNLLSAAEMARDPLLSFCQDYAKLRSRSAEHAQELCSWTDPLFEGPGFDETPEERRLRCAACLLSDIGWRAHPDYRGEQSLNVVAHAALSGIDHPGRIFLALAVYFRHAGQSTGGNDQLSGRLKAAASRRSLLRARVLGAAIRVAHMMSAGMPGIVCHTPLSYNGDSLVLSIPRARAALDGERLRRRFATLAELVARKPEVRIV
ncbi:Ppx/GppA phosphatase [Candidatus Filomicrobium marinum]|uniref:Ppx/GppA phosphatase n=2 Tax=Filomicrobium TaxID=119044 RepID=A0A0D6JKK4_9HYPH|nr:Ppx/GppA phosphatase [Candidatus Filomicrobium marinum]CPR22493.1 Ppx/GppA phosphatase [Candidatus Filomicrobium marinum]SDO82426.1 exopolyphosphatase / guanosine-5'-triphosphate,3'-diphosphate pyrophosphatase [Filomicrobium insigne]